MHALIIEQEMWITFVIEDALRELGYTSFVVASSQSEAVEAARIRSPDLITSAVRLNVGSGLNAVREICFNKVIPVVFVTSTPWQVRERDPGAIIVPKPFRQLALREGVARAVTSARRAGP